MANKCIYNVRMQGGEAIAVEAERNITVKEVLTAAQGKLAGLPDKFGTIKGVKQDSGSYNLNNIAPMNSEVMEVVFK